jgi:hypothetical protein
VPSAEPNAHKSESNRREETERDKVALSKDEAKTVRGWQDCEQQCGQGAGWGNMAKVTELLVNIVITNRPKLLIGLNQNGGEVEILPMKFGSTRFIRPPAKRQSLSCQR